MPNPLVVAGVIFGGYSIISNWMDTRAQGAYANRMAEINARNHGDQMRS